MASIAPNTPTTPSYFPEYGIASICDPVAIAATEESLPSLSTVRITEKIRHDTNMIALQLHDTILFSTYLSITSHRSHDKYNSSCQSLNRYGNYQRPKIFPTPSSLTINPAASMRCLTYLKVLTYYPYKRTLYLSRNYMSVEQGTEN